MFRTRTREKPLALVIDDDMSLRIAMRAALAKSGFDVVEADSGQAGLDLFKDEPSDLILLDVIMPGLSGYETCKEIRRLPGGEHVQIMMVTGLDDTESIERAFEAGANGFVAKPINWAMLGHRGKYMLRAGRAFQELDKSRKRLAKTQELAKIGNWEFDIKSSTFVCSAEASRLVGIKEHQQDPSLENFLSTVSEEERHSVKEVINAAVKAKKSFNINYRIVLTDGSERFILNHGEVLYSDNDEPEIILGAVQDVTELKQAEEEIRYLAFYDGLTGLANRMLFQDRLTQEIRLAERNKQQFALLYLDLDQFKRVNDTFGHHIGDLLLKKVSGALQKCIRATDTASRLVEMNRNPAIARLGGDEFTVILPNIKEPENAAFVARRILKEIPKPYILDGHEITATTSVGISLYPTDGTDASELLKHADTAMYQAKNNGRNTYQFYEESLNTAAIERFTIERDIAKAIERNEFLLYYQPKIDLQSRKIVGAEALIRWIHPQQGMIPPDKFISIAEESGQIIAINKWVINEACRQWKEWQDSGYDPGVIAVNLSGYQFAQQDIFRTIRSSVEAVNLSPSSLEIEITENILMQEEKEINRILFKVKEMGIRIALDDFGTGYSSLSYLASYPVDTIKIDRSFVEGCNTNKNKVILIKAIVALGHSLGMSIVAEGVEEEEELLIVSDLGANEAQGYLFSRPLPAEEFIAFFLQKQS